MGSVSYLLSNFEQVASLNHRYVGLECSANCKIAQIPVIVQKWPPTALGRKVYFLSELQIHKYTFNANIFLNFLWKILIYMFHYCVLLNNFKTYC